MNLISIDEAIKTNIKIITKLLTYFIENSDSKGRIIATLEAKKYATKKANAHARRLKSSLTKPLKNPKIREVNRIRITKISINDINLW